MFYAIAEATGYLKDGYQRAVDLASFFDQVHHQRLLARIAECVTDQRIVTLIRLMLKAAVGGAYCGKGAWVKSNRPAMTRAYSPSWFNGRMKSLKALWQGLHTPPVSAQLVLGF